MLMTIYNQVNQNYEKVSKTTKYFFNTFLKKFEKDKWKLDVWINNKKKSQENPLYSCGMSLKRPRRKTLYVEKEVRDLPLAIRKTTKSLAQILRGA